MLNTLTFLTNLFLQFRGYYLDIYHYFFPVREYIQIPIADYLTNKQLTIEYEHNNKQYKNKLQLHSVEHEPEICILSAELVNRDSNVRDLTDHIHTLAGPKHTFNFNNDIKVHHLIPSDLIDNDIHYLNIMVVVNGILRTITYHTLYDSVLFHYGINWGKYHQVSNKNTLKKLDYLNLITP